MGVYTRKYCTSLPLGVVPSVSMITSVAVSAKSIPTPKVTSPQRGTPAPILDHWHHPLTNLGACDGTQRSDNLSGGRPYPLPFSTEDPGRGICKDVRPPCRQCRPSQPVGGYAQDGSSSHHTIWLPPKTLRGPLPPLMFAAPISQPAGTTDCNMDNLSADEIGAISYVAGIPCTSSKQEASNHKSTE